MKIDRKLNIVIPLKREDGSSLWVYASPIRKEVFETYYLVLAKTFSNLATNGLDPRSGPSVAALLLKQTAMSTGRDSETNWWEGDDGVGGKMGLMAEIVRLSNCLVATPDEGWRTVPLQECLDRGLVTDDEKSEAMNLLAFFTVSSLVAPKTDRAILVKGMAAIYALEVTFSTFTEWATSFKTRIAEENTGEKKTAPALSDGTSTT